MSTIRRVLACRYLEFTQQQRQNKQRRQNHSKSHTIWKSKLNHIRMSAAATVAGRPEEETRAEVQYHNTPGEFDYRPRHVVRPPLPRVVHAVPTEHE